MPELPGDNVTVGGLKELPGPDGEIVAVSVIVPEKPFRLVRVMTDDESEAPASTLRVDWLEETAKPAGGVTVIVSEVELWIEPLTPFTVTV